MRSYYAHLETTTPSVGTAIAKPIYRSSAIFPVIHQEGISTRLLFLGYWLLKRSIDQIAAVVTLRSPAGEILARQLLTIVEAKAYRIEVQELLLQSRGIDETKPFEGSLEVEFYAATNLVFPFPAVVVNYYGEAFSSVVHTAQRVYNDYEDMQKNSQTSVPESGFNIHVDEKSEPFIGLVNGAGVQKEAQVKFEFYNRMGEVLKHTQQLGELKPYESRVLFPAREINLQSFLGGSEGACKAKFNLCWVFPRLLVGNRQRAPEAVSITHTYYDCSKATSSSDYWRAPEPAWHSASVMLPLWLDPAHFTNAYFYPIYSPSSLAIDAEIFSPAGSLLGSKQNVLRIDSPCQGFALISFKELLEELKIEPVAQLAARIIARPLGDSLMPARVKLGLDIGHTLGGLPCNICMNLHPFNPPFANKRNSFKWLPFLGDQPSAAVWLMNSSPYKEYQQTASLELNFYREKDCSTLKRKMKLPPQGFVAMTLTHDSELDAFFEGTIGWVTVTTDNPYLTSYYFADHPTGVIGGDHGF